MHLASSPALTFKATRPHYYYRYLARTQGTPSPRMVWSKSVTALLVRSIGLGSGKNRRTKWGRLANETAGLGSSLPERAGGRIGEWEGKGARRSRVYVPSFQFPACPAPHALTCERFKPQLHEAQISAPAPSPVLRSGELNRGHHTGVGELPRRDLGGGWGRPCQAHRFPHHRSQLHAQLRGQIRSEQASSETIVFFSFSSDSVHLMNRIEYS